MNPFFIPWDGIAAHDAGMLINRVVVGTFFAISGYHKLTDPGRRAELRKTLARDRVPFIRFNSVFVPIVETLAGVALAIGFLSVVSALMLGAICLVATCMDGVGRIKDYKPIDKADWLDDLLYLPEVLYGIMLVIVLCSGPGKFSIDSLLWR